MRTLICAWVCLAMLGGLPVVAQAATDRQEVIAIDGTDHQFHYDSRIRVARRAAVKEAFRRAMAAFAPAFGLPNLEVHIYFEHAPAASPTLLAVTGFVASPTPGKLGCNVTIYRHAETQAVASLKFTVAHELVHCFMHASRADVRTLNGSGDAATDENAWWMEGAAEYLASTVYAPAGRRMRDTLADFATIAGEPVFDKDYEQFWFFQYLATTRGNGAVVDVVKAMPIRRADQIASLGRAPMGPSQALFRDYAKAVAGRRLPRQPATTAIPVATFGGTKQLSTGPWSVWAYRYRLPAPRRNHGVRVSIMANGDPASYRLVSADGDITDGYSSCGHPAPRELNLAVGRAAVSAGKETAELSIKIDEVMCTPEITMASLAGVYIGYTGTENVLAPFLAQTLPSYPDNTSQYVQIVGDTRPNSFKIDINGTIQGQANGSQSHARGWVAFHANAITGHIALGDVVEAKLNLALLRATVQLTGSASGQGGTLEADGKSYRMGPVSHAMVFPRFTKIECQNIKVVDEVAKCGIIIFLQEDNRPLFELYRDL